MSAWITIAVGDLDDYLVGAQVNAMRTAALSDGQADPFENVMPDIIARIRRKIESCNRNRLSETENSIPPELKWLACYLIIEAMQVRLPSLGLTDDQRRQIEKAERDLDAIAACDLVVSTPEDPVEPESQQSGAITVVSSITRISTREKMNGL